MQTGCIIIAGTSRWQLRIAGADGLRSFDLPLAPNPTPADIAIAIESTLAAAGAVGAATLLAIPSAWCLNASIETSDLPRNDRTAMLYRLEEKLPVAAEAIAADFVEHLGRALGVCVQLERVKPLLDALELRHVIVQSVCPLALLAAQRQGIDTGVLLLAEAEAQQISVFTLAGGVVQSWALLPATAAAITRQLNFIALKENAPGTCTGIGLPESLSQGLQKQLTIEESSANSVELASEQAHRVLTGEATPWVELRRGSLAISDRLRLHRRPLNVLLAAVMLLLLATSTALIWRSTRYAKADAVARQNMEDAFREHFPDWQTPDNVRVIVESEHRKAVAAAGASPGRTTRSATRTLVDVLNHLPPDGRFTIESMSFADHSFELQGHVRSLDALDPLLASAKSTGMTISSPEAHKMPGGTWSFAVRGASEQQSAPLAKGDQ